ncbi:MAG: hypothetical protein HPKKFMNG_00853 [Planctomycetes bacterium]|nr:hypothetical protein [Planctomycetota bacterium]
MFRWTNFALCFISLSLFCSALCAENIDYFPRVRSIQDLVERASGSKYKDKTTLLGNELFSFGASAGYTSDYYWRGYQLFNEDLLAYADGYVNIYGFEASVWTMYNFNRSNLRPTETDYRFRYQFEIEGTIISLGYTWYDFAGSDGSLGKPNQGFGKKAPKEFPDDRFPSSIHEAQLSLSYFPSVLQAGGVNLLFTVNVFQRLDDEGTRIESSVTVFVESPQFTIFGDYFSITTTTTYQHRYLTNRSYFQGQTTHGRLVYNLDKYRIAPIFFVIEGIYYTGFNKDLVDGFYFGGSINIRF